MYKILMVEDDEIIVEIYKGKIEDEGYIVDIANDGETAFDRLKSFKPDLLLLDMRLPGLSGVDLLKTIRGDEQFKNLPVIAFSGDRTNHFLNEAKRFGATRVLSKGEFTPMQIVARITETLAIYMTPRKEEFVVQTLAEWQPPVGRVLIVEDDPVIMALVKDIVEEEDYAVVSAADGREAYQILSTDNNFVGGIFDVKTPFIEGPDLIRHMKTEKRLKQIPVLIMTANESLEVQSKSFSAGAAMCVLKPFTRASFKTMFGAVVNEGLKNQKYTKV